MSTNNNKVYKTTTTTTSSPPDPEENTSFLKNLIHSLTNKPVKKIYRLVLMALICLVANNTSNFNITDLLTNIMKQNICNNNTIIQ